MEIEVKPIKPGNRVFNSLRRNIYPFLSKKEIESWMNDEGHLRIRWFEARKNGKRVGIAAWEIYDIHQYQKGGQRFLILDLYTIGIEKAWRGKGVGKKLFQESLDTTIKELEKDGNFIVGGLLIETQTAVEFYRNILQAFSTMGWQEDKRSIAGNTIAVFWVPLR